MDWIKGKVETVPKDTTMMQCFTSMFVFLLIYRKYETVVIVHEYNRIWRIRFEWQANTILTGYSYIFRTKMRINLFQLCFLLSFHAVVGEFSCK